METENTTEEKQARGVVLRDNGRITDSYGREYVRQPDGSLRRAR